MWDLNTVVDFAHLVADGVWGNELLNAPELQPPHVTIHPRSMYRELKRLKQYATQDLDLLENSPMGPEGPEVNGEVLRLTADRRWHEPSS